MFAYREGRENERPGRAPSDGFDFCTMFDVLYTKNIKLNHPRWGSLSNTDRKKMTLNVYQTDNK